MTSLHLEYLQRIGVAASYYYMAECLYHIEDQIQSKREPRVARLVGASGWLPTGQRSSLARHWFLIKKNPSSAPCAKAQLGLPLVVDPPSAWIAHSHGCGHCVWVGQGFGGFLDLCEKNLLSFVKMPWRRSGPHTSSSSGSEQACRHAEYGTRLIPDIKLIVIASSAFGS